MPDLPEDLLAEEGIAEAFAAMQEAVADPDIRSLIEARACSQQEDLDLLEMAHRHGEICGRSDGENETAAERYAELVFALWIAKHPPGQPQSCPFEPSSDPERYRWWRFDEEKAQLDNNSYIANFRSALAKNFLRGCSGESASEFA